MDDPGAAAVAISHGWDEYANGDKVVKIRAMFRVRFSIVCDKWSRGVWRGRECR